MLILHHVLLEAHHDCKIVLLSPPTNMRMIRVVVNSIRPRKERSVVKNFARNCSPLMVRN